MCEWCEDERVRGEAGERMRGWFTAWDGAWHGMGYLGLDRDVSRRVTRC